MYVYLGKVAELIANKSQLKLRECINNEGCLTLLVREPVSSPIKQVVLEEECKSVKESEDTPMKTELEDIDEECPRRTKERQIKFVVERVSLWRKLYNGVDMGNGETVRYSLEDSAGLVGISKKSLDDYLL